MKSTLSHLAEIGLSEYEAKVYLSLLKESPSTAYEIAKLSGVPTSKVYGVLGKLGEKNMISIVEDEKIKRYLPLEPDDFLNMHRKKVEKTITSLEGRLSGVRGEKENLSIWSITEYDYLMLKARRMIEGAGKTILLSIWKEELEQIEDVVTQAFQRGVQVAIVHFGQTRMRAGQVYQHPIEDTVYHGKGGRGFVLVVDSQEVLTGTVYKYGRVEGAWSRNRGFATLAEDYIKHDIYIMKIIRRFDRTLQERFGSRYRTLRDIFTDEEAKP
jgi:sugar-specific transcriptional regulator TrmB